MGFWESFKESYREARYADLHGLRKEVPDPPFETDWPPAEEPHTEEASASERVVELEAALRECMLELRSNEATLRQRNGQVAESEQLSRDLAGQLAEAKQLIVDLAAESERLGKELKERATKEGNSGTGDAKFQKLRRFVLKKIHPDLAGGDKRLSAVLQAICKDINAEIGRIDTA